LEFVIFKIGFYFLRAISRTRGYTELAKQSAPIFCFLKKKAKGFALLSGLGQHFLKQVFISHYPHFCHSEELTRLIFLFRS